MADLAERKAEAASEGNLFAASFVFNGQPIEVEAFYNWETQGNDPEIITIEAAFTEPDGEITHLLQLIDWQRTWLMPSLHVAERWQDPIRIAMFGGRGRPEVDPETNKFVRWDSDYRYGLELRMDWQLHTLGDKIEELIRESTDFQDRVRSHYADFFDDGW